MKTPLLFLCICIWTTGLKSQDSHTSDHITLISGQTIYGEIAYLDQRNSSTRYLKKIKVKTTEGKRKKYRTDKVASFTANGADFEIFRLEQSANLFSSDHAKFQIDIKNGEVYILKRISRGPLSHYTFDWSEQGESLQMSMDLFRKEGDPFFIRANQGMLGLKRKLLANYFSDCPDLAEMIRTKSLNSVPDVVEYYNDGCAVTKK